MSSTLALSAKAGAFGRSVGLRASERQTEQQGSEQRTQRRADEEEEEEARLASLLLAAESSWQLTKSAKSKQQQVATVEAALAGSCSACKFGAGARENRQEHKSSGNKQFASSQFERANERKSKRTRQAPLPGSLELESCKRLAVGGRR